MTETNEKSLIVEFPQYLIDGVLDNATIHDVINYSLYKLSMLVDYSMSQIAEDAVINFYEHRYDYEILHRLFITMDVDFVGMQDNFTECSKEEEDEMLFFFKLDRELEQSCIETYQVKQILKHIGVSGYVPYIIKEGKRIYNESLANPDKRMMNVNINGLFAFKVSFFF